MKETDAMRLPKGWKIKKLGDVCNIRSGRDYKKVIDTNGAYPIIGSAGKPMGYTNQYICKAGTTIIGRKGTINSPVYIETNFWNVDTAFGFQACECLDKKYLFLFCLLFDFSELDKGSGRPSLVKSDLKQIPIPVPPLPEQKRIVSILDHAFEAIDKVKANAEQNLKNAKELFESYLQGVFEKKGDDWEEHLLNEISEVRDGTHDSPKYVEEGYPLVTSKNLKKGKLTFHKIKFIKKEDYDNINKRSKVNIGDILFAMIGTIGNPVIVFDEPKFAIKNVALFKFDKTQSNKFVKYYFETKYVIDKMQKEAKGTTQRFVGLGYLRNFPISLPPLHEQQQIVQKLDALSAETKKLESIYQKKIADLEELKKSILKKAFAGELKL